MQSQVTDSWWIDQEADSPDDNRPNNPTMFQPCQFDMRKGVIEREQVSVCESSDLFIKWKVVNNQTILRTASDVMDEVVYLNLWQEIKVSVKHVFGAWVAVYLQQFISDRLHFPPQSSTSPPCSDNHMILVLLL